MITPAPNQTLSGMLSGSWNTYRRNFGKLYLIFALSFIIMLLPFIFNLDTYVTQLHAAVKDQDGTMVAYTVIYIFMPLITNGILEGAFASIWIIGIFVTPFFMGMAGKITMDDAIGKRCSLKDAARWALGQYKHLLLAYAIYYVVFIAYSVSMLALLKWIIWDASHLIGDVWTNPTMVLAVVGFIILLVGTIYLPFVAMGEKKGTFRAYLGSFKAMYSRSFPYNFPGLLLVAAIAGGVSYGILYPVAPRLFSGVQAYAMDYLTHYDNVMTLIFVAIAVFSLVGVFLYIFAYNTYRKAAKVTVHTETVNKTYRRKLNFVEPTYRRRIG